MERILNVRTWVVLLTLCTLGSVASAQATSTGTTAATTAGAMAQAGAPTSTSLKVFTPYVGSGLSVGVAVKGHVEGSCFTSSVASPERPDAWRCSAGNAILDPCFVDVRVDEMQLACAQDPFSADVTLLALSEALPSSGAAAEPDYREATPWALELQNGQRCVSLTGATGAIAGLRVNYGCAGGGVVVGGVDRTSSAWQVFYQSAEKSIALEQVEVRTAWY